MLTQNLLPRRALPLTLVLAVSATVAACATSGTRPASQMSAAPRAESSSQYVLRAADINRQSVNSVYDALLRLRPEFLQPRNPTPDSPNGALPIVYVDNTYMGDINELRRLSSAQVREIQLLSNFDARERFGKLFPAGVIVVRTR